jgi:flagellar hook capping protein FlgD
VFASTSPALAVALDLDPNVLNPRARGRWITAYIESSEFDPSQIDLTTVKLAGIVPAEARPTAVGDHDADGISDLMVKFSRDALDPFLVPGLNSLEVTGSLVTGEKFSGTDTVRVLHPPAGKRLASVAPNPFNPAGTLTFRTSALGRATVRLFDLQGRVLRTIVEMEPLPAGIHEVRIDGKDGRGQPLATGVYFYGIETVDGSIAGRFTILK